jgi:signal transduction histidine kinase
MKPMREFRRIHWIIIAGGIALLIELIFGLVLLLSAKSYGDKFKEAILITLLIGMGLLICITMLAWIEFRKWALQRHNRMAEDPLLPKDGSELERKAQYAEDLSHELLTPVAILNSKIELLLQSPNLGEKELLLVDAMQETLNRMLRTNRGLILLSKIDHGLFVDRELADITDIVKKTLDNYEDSIQRRQLKVIVYKDGQPDIMTNRNLMEILVNNLIKNAVNHNMDGGEIYIHVNPELLVISNTGKESENSPEELFTRFVTESSSSTSVGLGLSIAKKICATLGYALKYVQSEGRHTLTVIFSES